MRMPPLFGLALAFRIVWLAAVSGDDTVALQSWLDGGPSAGRHPGELRPPSD
jgi:hypothetical protein